MDVKDFVFMLKGGTMMLAHRDSSQRETNCRVVTDAELDALTNWYLLRKSVESQRASMILPEGSLEPLFEVHLIEEGC